MSRDSRDLYGLTQDPQLLRRALWIVWTLPGVLHALQAWLFLGYPLSLRLLIFNIPLWWPWIPATYWVLKAARRLPMTPDGPPRFPILLFHLGAAFFSALAHMIFYLIWQRLWRPETAESWLGDYVILLLQPIFMASVFTYLLIAGSQLIAGAAGRLHDKELQENRIMGRLAEAEIRSLRMQLQPESLAQSLEDLSETVSAGHLEEAEEAIDELAGNLRETLRHGDNLPEVWSNPDFEKKNRPT